MCDRLDNVLRSLAHEARSATRTLRNSFGFASVVFVVLTLAIGASTAIFTVVHSVLLRPLPYHEPDRLAMVWQADPRFVIEEDRTPVTAGDYMNRREQTQLFENVSVLAAGRWSLVGQGAPERISGASVSPEFFELLGVVPQTGRAFLRGEDDPGASKVVVISDSLWRRRFASDPGVIGAAMDLDGESYSVIGVAPAGFRFPEARALPFFTSATEIWRPNILDEAFISRDRNNRQFFVIARLNADVTPEAAQVELTARMKAADSDADGAPDVGVRVVPLEEQIVGNAAAALWVMMGAVIFVLMIACANVANLLLARSAARERETAIRMALGSGSTRVGLQLFFESLLLSAASTVAGVLLGSWALRGLVVVGGETVPRAGEVGLHLGVLGFAIALAFATTAIFTLIPARRVAAADVATAINGIARSVSGGGRSRRLRSSLVVTQVGLAFVLLAGAGLFLKSLDRTLNVDPGFSVDKTVAVQLSLTGSRYARPEQQVAMFSEVVQRVQGLAGVQAAGLVSEAPLTGGVYAGSFAIEGVAELETGARVADRRMISSDYFSVLRIPLLRGRVFDAADDSRSAGVAIVSEGWARRFLSNENAIGRRIRIGPSDRPWLTIVGVVGDIRDTSLESSARPTVYLPYPQFPTPGMALIVRSPSDAESLIPVIREEVWAVDKDQPISDARTMQQWIDKSVASRQFNTFLLAAFAGVALVLAAVGIYSVIAYSVAQQKREIGIRVSMGARPRDVAKQVVGRALVLCLVGVVAGLGGALALSQFVAGLLYDVRPTDAGTLGGVALLLSAIALLSSYLPVRAALRVDPVAVLKSE
jgi:putative ABC transport system permease protein